MSLHSTEVLDKIQGIYIPGSLYARCKDKHSPIREVDIYIYGYLRANSRFRGNKC